MKKELTELAAENNPVEEKTEETVEVSSEKEETTLEEEEKTEETVEVSSEKEETQLKKKKQKKLKKVSSEKRRNSS